MSATSTTNTTTFIDTIFSYSRNIDIYRLNKAFYKTCVHGIKIIDLQNILKDSPYVACALQCVSMSIPQKIAVLAWMIMYNPPAVTTFVDDLTNIVDLTECVTLEHVKIALLHGADYIAMFLLKRINGGKTHVPYVTVFEDGNEIPQEVIKMDAMNLMYAELYGLALSKKCRNTSDYIIENGVLTGEKIHMMFRHKEYDTIINLSKTNMLMFQWAITEYSCKHPKDMLELDDYKFILEEIREKNMVDLVVYLLYHYVRSDVFEAIYSGNINVEKWILELLSYNLLGREALGSIPPYMEKVHKLAAIYINSIEYNRAE